MPTLSHYSLQLYFAHQLKPSKPFYQYQIFVKAFLWGVVLWLCSRYPKFGRRIVIWPKRLLLSLRKFLSNWLGYKPLKIRINMCSVEHHQGLIRDFWALYPHSSCSNIQGFGTGQIQRKFCQTPLGFLCSLCTAKYSERAFCPSSCCPNILLVKKMTLC